MQFWLGNSKRFPDGDRFDCNCWIPSMLTCCDLLRKFNHYSFSEKSELKTEIHLPPSALEYTSYYNALFFCLFDSESFSFTRGGQIYIVRHSMVWNNKYLLPSLRILCGIILDLKWYIIMSSKNITRRTQHFKSKS